MNLKLNNEVRSSVNLLHKPPVSSVKEERRRTGRYIAILVGICLLMLAIYHAWVRRIPVVASLVVPALIMFVYVGWVLYTASRDKKRLLLLDAEAALNAASLEHTEDQRSDGVSHNSVEISVISNKDNSKVNSPQETHTWAEVCTTLLKEDNETKENKRPVFIKPIILVNDKPAEDLDEKWTHVLETVYGDNLKNYQRRRKFKRKYCRSRRYAAFKRSYSIG
ncbi:uncharacterized protein LOC123691136 isoform X1 [Colias croceus]|uniref:uncharacterized protein LOC123691136 isoform X1 n=1 Tax=Colias crocea TaxID=72248 RepID=UPI001E280B08|nr:uncharacterized protein LOC123691136 isoform X1 [Colias croceus]XP_045491334.1 uncharacterized protein LOC123691136 isoform X1 [Colias croceus]XP_045491335.1 uncharacterized protein LOC123691136 isoform X1 [Colias croceus]